MSKVLDVEVTTNNDGTFQARIAGYRAQGCTIEAAVANVAGMAARELCGEWRIAGVELVARVTLEGVAT